MNKSHSIMPRLLSALCLLLPAAVWGQLTPESLRVEHLSENILIDVPREQGFPRLSWVNTPAEGAFGEHQTAYRLCVATSEQKLLSGKPDVWDSGRTPSDRSYLVPYGGPQLRPATHYWWRVQVWNAKGKPSAWSAPQRFTTGIDQWQAQWIGAPWQGEESQYNVRTGKTTPQHFAVPYLRTTFSLDKEVRSAKAYVTGLGYFEFFVNGQKAGRDLLVPNFTNYTRRENLEYNDGLSYGDHSSGYHVSYLMYDVTSLLRRGRNAVGAMIAGGYFDDRFIIIGGFASPRFLCRLVIDYADGTQLNVVSSPKWRARESGIVNCDLYDGENYDARRELTDWCSPELDDSGWANAVERRAPDGRLKAFDTRPDRVTQTLRPVAFKRQADGSYDVDFGEMISGHVRLKGVRGAEGQTLRIRYVSNYPREATYTFKDAAPIDYAPQFSWQVFRHVIVTGAELTADQITAEAVNTDLQQNATFTSSNELFNDIQKIWLRTERDNVHSGVESDCPHRERVPYTGDGQVVTATVMQNFDGSAFYRSWLATMRDVQDVRDGYLANSAPWCVRAGGGVGWGAAITLIPWEYYLAYGDEQVLRENYDAARRQTEYMLRWVRPDGTMCQQRTNELGGDYNKWFNLGDWVPAFGLPDTAKVHTYVLWRCADRMARMAHVLGHTADEQRFASLARRTALAYNNVFYENDSLGFGDFGCNTLALEMGLLAERPQLRDIVAHEIGVRYKGHLNCGYVSLEVFFENLARAGLNNLAYTAMNKTDYPSFGYMVKDGSTTMWEYFAKRDSENHPFLGCCLTWFYRSLAGVRTDAAAPAYKHFTVRPVPADSLQAASYTVQSPYGQVSSSVHYEPGRMSVEVVVPVGSTATVYMPLEPYRHYQAVAGKAGKGYSKAVVKTMNRVARQGKRTPEGYAFELEQGRYTITAER